MPAQAARHDAASSRRRPGAFDASERAASRCRGVVLRDAVGRVPRVVGDPVRRQDSPVDLGSRLLTPAGGGPSNSAADACDYQTSDCIDI